MSTNPFYDLETAASYEIWYQTIGRQAGHQEEALLNWLLARFPEAHTILEIGCGTGHFTRWFRDRDILAVGIDLSRPMLEEAKRLGGRVYLQGDALNLPFCARSFDLAALITTLEFLQDPFQALVEAKRIASQGLILGVLNAQSRLGRAYKLKGGPIWDAARFYSLDELKRILRKIAGEKARISWRTTLWSPYPGALPLPWGGFIGMVVRLFDQSEEEK